MMPNVAPPARGLSHAERPASTPTQLGAGQGSGPDVGLPTLQLPPPHHNSRNTGGRRGDLGCQVFRLPAQTQAINVLSSFDTAPVFPLRQGYPSTALRTGGGQVVFDNAVAGRTDSSNDENR